MNGNPIHFHLECRARLVIQPPRHIPYHLQLRYGEMIKEMENNDVIEQYHSPVTWLANPVLVSKPDGNMTVTADLRSLNQALFNPHLPIPRVEDVLPMFNGKFIFSKLDLKTAFYQPELDQESQSMIVFRAGHRLMRYKRLTTGTLKGLRGAQSKAPPSSSQHPQCGDYTR